MISAIAALTSGLLTATSWAQNADAPVISNFEISPQGFSPDGDQINDTTVISYVIADTAQSPAFDVTLRVEACDGTIRRLLHQGQQAAGLNRVTWDGKDDDGNTLPDGAPFVRLQVSNGAGTTQIVSEVVLDTFKPVIEAIYIDHTPFSPNGDGLLDDLEIRVQPFDECIRLCNTDSITYEASIIIYDLVDRPLFTFFRDDLTNCGEPFSLVATWDGSGAPDGFYRYVVRVEDDSHNWSDHSGLIDLDRRAPVVRFTVGADTLFFDKPEPAALTGLASDRNNVVEMDVSYDGGLTWTPLAVTEPGPEWSPEIPDFLPPGEGVFRILLRATDGVGNRNDSRGDPAPGPPAVLTVVVRRGTEVAEGVGFHAPRPFRPGDSFRVAPGRIAQRVVVRIYNLASDMVATLEAGGPAEAFSIPWRAENDVGEKVLNGAYICRIDVAFPEGRAFTTHLPLVVIR